MLTALLMLTAWIPFASAAPEDWNQLQITLTWINPDGVPESFYAAPVEDAEYCFWAWVPEEALSGLALNLFHPMHPYFFTPESGILLTDIIPAGESMDGMSYTLIRAAEGDTWEDYYLYISTTALMPIPAEEEPYTEPGPATPAEPYTGPGTELPAEQPYTEPEVPAESYTEPYTEPEVPAEVYTEPYTEPEVPAESYTEPYTEPEIPAVMMSFGLTVLPDRPI